MNKKNEIKSVNTVRGDYNKISAHFASTRHYQWPEMKRFSAFVKTGWSVLDIGCGSGRLLESLKDKKVEYLGIDSSEKLVKIAKQKYPKNKFQIMSMENLELADDKYDAVFAIASLHHLATRSLRLRALSEANRVLKKDGYFFVTVWNLWQPKYRKYIWQNFFNIIFKGSKTRFGDTFIPWKDPARNVLAQRYYFAYTLSGLKKDLKSAGFLTVELKRSRWNIYAICKKG